MADLSVVEVARVERAVYNELPHIPGIENEDFYVDLAARIASVAVAVATPLIGERVARSLEERARNAERLARLPRMPSPYEHKADTYRHAADVVREATTGEAGQ